MKHRAARVLSRRCFLRSAGLPTTAVMIAARACLAQKPMGSSHNSASDTAATDTARADKQRSVSGKALISITLDLEMSRNFPTWEATHWDYEKGNLDAAAKQYSVAVAKRVAEAGGVAHFFVVGQVLEQADVQWLREIAAAGHLLGNHTYDHVNVTAAQIADVQLRFQRAPWLAAGRSSAEVIRENIRMCSQAMQQRLDIARPVGFRTPGGFARGLHDHPYVREELLDQGFTWVSSLYPTHPNTKPGEKPTDSIIEAIVAAQQRAQPFTYADGLIEIPMSPISDIGAFRTGRWELAWFQKTIARCVEWAIEHRAVFDFLAHPSCLGIVDPDLKTVDMICDMVAAAGPRAALVGLDAVALREASNSRSK